MQITLEKFSIVDSDLPGFNYDFVQSLVQLSCTGVFRVYSGRTHRQTHSQVFSYV